MKNFYEMMMLLEATAGGVMQWGREQQNKFYEKGVRDAMEDSYDPPTFGSPMSAASRKQYIDGWRSMGKQIPPGKHNSKSSLSDREWYRDQLRIQNYSKATGNKMVNIMVSQNPEWDDPDYDPTKG